MKRVQQDHTYRIKEILNDVFHLHGQVEPHRILPRGVGVVISDLCSAGRRNPVVARVSHVPSDRADIEVLIVRLFRGAETDRGLGVPIRSRPGPRKIGHRLCLVNMGKIYDKNGVVPSSQTHRGISFAHDQTSRQAYSPESCAAVKFRAGCSCRKEMTEAASSFDSEAHTFVFGAEVVGAVEVTFIALV